MVINIKKEKKPLRMKLYYVFMCFFTVFITFIAIQEFSKSKVLSVVEQNYSLQLDQEMRSNISLQNELEYINTDTYIEKAVRKNLGLIKQNEIIFKKK